MGILSLAAVLVFRYVLIDTIIWGCSAIGKNTDAQGGALASPILYVRACLRHCRVRPLSGAMFLAQGDATMASITNTTISNCVALGASAYGGVAFVDAVDGLVAVSSTTMEHNKAQSTSFVAHGGAFYVRRG